MNIPDRKTKKRWDAIRKKLDEQGASHYLWLVGLAPPPIKGLEQRYILRKLNKIDMSLYESKHTYSKLDAKYMAREKKDFEMTKVYKPTPTQCIFEHCDIIGIGYGGYCRDLLQYVVESTGEIILK